MIIKKFSLGQWVTFAVLGALTLLASGYLPILERPTYHGWELVSYHLKGPLGLTGLIAMIWGCGNALLAWAARL